jgi:L-Lysine epsilon oxidase N-terminal/L-lysine epsilon oxidase C-terminal domain
MIIDAAAVDWVGIYPPIGIARVGNAEGEDDYTLASEVVGGVPDARGGFRDAKGMMKRQAVRFRIYARLKTGSFVEVVHGDGNEILWRVEVANLKPGWYAFDQAMDLPAGKVREVGRRNAETGRRAQLDISPSPKRISGASVTGPEYRFDDGQFFQKFVYLGEVRTDAAGRLLVLGGRGRSAPLVRGMRPTTFANNDLWHDDIADGPVRATVRIGNRTFDADPGYVAITPPNFAPGLNGLVTMDDTVREAFVGRGWLQPPKTTDFTADVWPIFDRLTGLQWVNHGHFIMHGWGSPLDARDPSAIARLADASIGNRPWRQRVFSMFRDPAGGTLDDGRIPSIYGDAFGTDDTDGQARLSVTPTMHQHLRRWAEGNFTSSWAEPPVPPTFDTLGPDDQVAHLQRCGLADCLGGPFHPGIELTWTMRWPGMWELQHRSRVEERYLYRLHLLPEGVRTRQDYGSRLTRDVCLAADGPLDAVGPGSLTRWLGLPWQTDEASCNSSADYAPSTFLSMPTYWGARVPDQVLSSESWLRATDASAGPNQRLKHFAHRSDWLRDVRDTTYFARIDNMIRDWWTLGILETKSVPPHLLVNGLPPTVIVESGRHPRNTGTDPKPALVASIEQLAANPQTGQAGIANPASGGAVEAAASAHEPPRRSFRQGEI